MTAPSLRVGVAENLARIPATGVLSTAVYEHGTMRLKLYAPRGSDPQQPHSQDELYLVHAGRGRFRCGAEVTGFGPGDVLFVPAGAVHRFEDFSDDLVVWVVFWGPAGGDAGNRIE